MHQNDMNLQKYRLKAVVFDLQAECRVLKNQISEAGIRVIVPFFGLQVEHTLREMLKGSELEAADCLLITNNAQHARIAEGLSMAVVGCIEGHFEVPKTDTLLESPEEVSIGYLNQVYCHQKNCPAMIAETDRCYIRELTKEDMDDLYEILAEKEVAAFLPAKAGTREEELDKLTSYVSHVYSFFGYGYWGVFSKRDGKMIGRAGFKEGSYPPEAGYVTKRSLWGQGLATEILQALLIYAKEELDSGEVLARIDSENKASLRVAEKCGFFDTGEREYLSSEGKQREIQIVRYAM